nr:hypothetical protein [Streptomyces incarnatus]
MRARRRGVRQPARAVHPAAPGGRTGARPRAGGTAARGAAGTGRGVTFRARLIAG